MRYQQIIIFACGLAGVLCALRLQAKMRGKPCHIILIQAPHANTQASFNQGAIARADYSDNLKQRLARTDIECVDLAVQKIHRDRQLLVLQNGISLRYDFLVLPEYEAHPASYNGRLIDDLMATVLSANRMAKRLQQSLRNAMRQLGKTESKSNCFVMRSAASRQAALRRKTTASFALLSLVAYVAAAIRRLHVRFVFLQWFVPGLFKALEQYYQQPVLGLGLNSTPVSLRHSNSGM